MGWPLSAMRLITLLGVLAAPAFADERKAPPKQPQCIEHEKPYTGCKPCGIVCPIMCQLYDPDRPLCIRWSK